jgi:hypothetical protein
VLNEVKTLFRSGTERVKSLLFSKNNKKDIGQSTSMSHTLSIRYPPIDASTDISSHCIYIAILGVSFLRIIIYNNYYY